MKSIRRVAVTLAAAALVVTGGLLVHPNPAAAHGATVFPGSRQYLCWVDGLDSTGQILPTNPACQNWLNKSGSTPFYNWFGNLHPSANGGTVGTIPDGRICDGGDAGPYDFSPLNEARNDWPLTHLTAGATYQFRHNNWAEHPGRFDVYITRQGWNPSTPLTWAELELIDTEVDPPANGGPGGLNYYYWDFTFPADRSGYHIVFTHWVRSDSPENFYSCSDVVFDGGNGEVTGIGGDPGPTQSPIPSVCPDTPAGTPGPAIISGISQTGAVATWGAASGCVTAYELVDTQGGGETVLATVTGNPPATAVNLSGLTPNTNYRVAVRAINGNIGQSSSLSESAPFTTLGEGQTQEPPPGGDCTVTYDVVNDWGQGFQAEITVTNNSSSTINGWELAWSFPSGQTITQLWNGIDSQSGPNVTVRNESWNLNISANGGQVSLGFLGTPGGGSAPSTFTLNGSACAVG